MTRIKGELSIALPIFIRINMLHKFTVDEVIEKKKKENDGMSIQILYKIQFNHNKTDLNTTTITSHLKFK